MKIVRQNYNKNKSLFNKLKKELEVNICENVQICHVGSTAIPNMYGKNIIDVLIGVYDCNSLKVVSKILKTLGYYKSRKSSTKDYEFFASSEEETSNGDVHIHLSIIGTDRFNDFILLKNYLLQNPKEAENYSNFKKQIIKNKKVSRNLYRNIKSEYVCKLLKQSSNIKSNDTPFYLTIVRHGENLINSNIDNNLLQLTRNGIKQANEVKKILDNNFDIIISSPSKRARQTAHIICGKLDYLQDFRLIERGWGNGYKGNESDETAKKRFKKFFNEIITKYSGKNILLVTHGSLMRIAQDVIENSNEPRNRVDYCTIIQYKNNSQNKFEKLEININTKKCIKNYIEILQNDN